MRGQEVMKRINLPILVKVNDKGFPLISNKDEMMRFFKKHPGAKAVMSTTIFPGDGSKNLIGYYFKKIVPDFQNIYKEIDGEYLTLKTTDEKLRGLCPIMHEEVPKEESGGFDLVRIKSVYELNKIELVEFVEFIKMLAGNQYDYFIENPNSFL